MRVRSFGLSLLLILCSAGAAGAVDYYHRDPARPDCRTMRIDDGRRIAEKYMCRGDDGEYHEEAPDYGDEEEAPPPQHRHSEPAAAAELVGPDASDLSLTTVRSLTMNLSNIDDLGLVMVIPPSGKAVMAAGTEWSTANQGGSAKADIASHLATGRNTVVFVLHNKHWIFGVSNWAFNASLSGDGRVLWQDSRPKRKGGVGIQYWKAFTAIRHKDGSIAVEAASPEVIRELEPRIAALNGELIRNHGTEQSAYGVAVGLVFAAIVSGMSSSGNSSNGSAVHHTPQPCYDYDAPGCH